MNPVYFDRFSIGDKVVYSGLHDVYHGTISSINNPDKDYGFITLGILWDNGANSTIRANSPNLKKFEDYYGKD